MSSTNEIQPIKVSEIGSILREFHAIEQRTGQRMTPHFISHPGVGKTTSVQQYLETLNAGRDPDASGEHGPWVLADYSLLQSTPDDMRGATSFIDLPGGLKVSSNCPPRIFPIEGYPDSADGQNVLIFFDELDKAPALLQQLAACVMDGRVGDYRIDQRRTFVVMASNIDVQGAFQTPENIVGRVCDLVVEADPAEWLAWADGENLHPTVMSFVSTYTHLLSQAAPPTSHGFPSPRSWHRVALFLEQHPTDWSMPGYIAGPVIVGYLGPTVGHELIRFCQRAANLNIRHIFDGEFGKAPTTTSDQMTLVREGFYIIDRVLREDSADDVLQQWADAINRFFMYLKTLDVSLVVAIARSRNQQQAQAVAKRLHQFPELETACKAYEEIVSQMAASAPTSGTAHYDLKNIAAHRMPFKADGLAKALQEYTWGLTPGQYLDAIRVQLQNEPELYGLTPNLPESVLDQLGLSTTKAGGTPPDSGTPVEP